MSAHEDRITAAERARKSRSVARGDTDTGSNTPMPAKGDRRPPAVLDPTNPASKPYGTTKDQISTMEGEGQAQTPGQESPEDISEKSREGVGKPKAPRRGR